MQARIKTILPVLVVIVGAALLFYPWISNWIYSHSVGSSVNVYEQEVEEKGNDDLEQIWKTAEEYNEALSRSKVNLTDPFTEEDIDEMGSSYEDVLSLDEDGLMCFVSIPKIDVYLPVYHGTSEEVLQKGAGHLEGSALPVGGEGNRSVISAHTGINSAKMFTDLVDLEEGDLFFIYVLDEVHAYRVCDIRVIEPEDTGSLVAEEGRDLVTLLTCTPYGVNTQRLIVTGERTEYSDKVVEEAAAEEPDDSSQWMQAYGKAVLAGLGIVGGTAGMMAWIVHWKKKRRGQNG